MRDLVNRLRLVILKSPYEIWDNPRVFECFSDMVRLKRLGYGRNYPEGVLPVDTTDFIATHVLLYDLSSPREPRILMGFKSTTAAVCKRYNLVFPGLGLVRSANAPDHVKVVEGIMAARPAEKLAYLGSWTADPDLKRDPELRKALKEIFVATYTNFYKASGVTDVVIGGTLRFHTERTFADLGHAPLNLAGRELPPISVTHLVGEKVLVMHAHGFNEKARVLVDRWKPLWDSRLEIGEAVFSMRRTG